MNIKDLVSKLTFEEKLSLLTGKDNWSTVPVERLGIPSVTVSDGPHGLRKVKQEGPGIEFKQYEAVAFPTYSAVSSTWNTELAEKMGKAIAGDCIDHDVDIILGPGTNMKRTPLCGRNFEYFSEDPYLAGKFAAAFINGVQSRGIGTSLKHFAGNSQEIDRFWVSSEIDERTLREIYLPAFEEAVKESDPWTVMCAYNKVNGVHSSQNKHLLDDILKKEWGFKGIVVSDWGAVHDRAASLKASLDLEMPHSDESFSNLKKAYESGLINDEDIDGAVEGILNLIDRIVKAKPLRKAEKDNVESRVELSKKIAEEAITLLKNEDNILPVNKEKVKKIAIIGALAETPAIQGGGSAGVTPVHLEKPLDMIREIAGDSLEVTFAKGYNYWEGQATYEIKNVGETLEAAYDADMVLLFVGNNGKIEAESYDRQQITLQPEMEDIIKQVSKANPNTVVVIQAGSAIDMRAWINNVKGVVFSWFTGGAGGSAIANVLFGKVNPSGKLSETFPLCIEDTPAYGSYPGNGKVAWHKEGIFIGYRHYDIEQKDVLFPFGYGLSYTSFEYSDLKLSTDKLSQEKDVIVSFKVKNTGNVKGKEVAQVYVKDVISSVLRPEKELKGFAKVELEPGEEKKVTVKLDKRAFAFYSMVSYDWEIEEGSFEILVGASSRDIRLKARIDY